MDGGPGSTMSRRVVHSRPPFTHSRGRPATHPVHGISTDPLRCGRTPPSPTAGLRVVGVDFKMNYSGHVFLIGAVGGYRFLSGGRLIIKISIS